MEFIDYNVEMLRQYFYEQNFTKERISYILERNPFNRDFTVWEQQNINNNRKFAYLLKTNRLIQESERLIEVVNHEDNSVGKYLVNHVDYQICSSNKKLYLNITRPAIVLIKGIFNQEEKILKGLDLERTPIIIGVCTRNQLYYQRCKEFYDQITNELEMVRIVNENSPQKIYIAKSK